MSTVQHAIPLSRNISSIDKEWLIREVRIDEVWQAVKQIGPLKALDAEGMHAIFDQRCWNVKGKTTCSMIRVLHHVHLLKKCSYYFNP